MAIWPRSDPAGDLGSWRPKHVLLIVPTLLYLVVLYLWPLSRLGAWSLYAPHLSLMNYESLFADRAYITALRNTVQIAFIVTVFCLLVAYPFAFALTKMRPAVSQAFLAAILIPFGTSILVRSFAWVIILGDSGIVNKLLLSSHLITKPLKLIYNMIGVQLAMVHVLLPFMVFPIYAVMLQMDLSLVRASRSLGASPFASFTKIYLPLSLPGVASGCCMVFLLAVGYYITPALVGGRGEITLATLIDMYVNELINWGLGSSLAVLLLVVVGGLYVLFTLLLGIKVISSSQARL